MTDDKPMASHSVVTTLYEAPTRGDFQSKVSGIIHEARHKLDKENGRLIVKMHTNGLSQSSGLISDVVSCANQLHAEAMGKFARLGAEFVGRGNLTPTDLGSAARPLLEKNVGLRHPEGSMP
jgi:hypothetical protein